MQTFYFEVNDVQQDEEHWDGQLFKNKVAVVEAVVKDKLSGNTIFRGEIPVRFNEEGVFPSVKAVNAMDVSKEIKTELLFRSKRYIKRLRKWL